MDKKSALAIAASVVLVSASGVAALGTNAGVISWPEIEEKQAEAKPANKVKKKSANKKAWKTPKPRVVTRVVDVPVVVPGGTIVRTLPAAASAPAPKKTGRTVKRLADPPKKTAPKATPKPVAKPAPKPVAKPAPKPAAAPAPEAKDEPDAKAKAEWEREKAKQEAEKIENEAEREAAKKAAEEAFEEKKESGDEGER